MNHEVAQLAISARMDGEPVDVAGLETHLADCAECRRFAETATSARAAIRIREADRVPDLVGVIMARLETLPTHEPAVAGSDRDGPPGRIGHPRRGAWRRLLPVAAALAAGAVVGSVIVGGPFRGADRRAISAEAVVRAVRGASPAVRSFDATYAIVERGSVEAPVRRLDMRVAFLAPQRFLLEVRDRTSYADGSVPTDVTVVSSAAATAVTAPSGCPPAPPASPSPSCPPVRTTIASGASHPLADLIVPMTTFGSSGGVRVLGREATADGEAVRVELSFARAAPLFPFLEFGRWRPFFQGDRVELLLDGETWTPRRIVVSPIDSEARRAWELRFGLPPEPAGTSILEVRAVDVDPTPPAAELFDVRPRAATVEVSELADAVGFRPAVPADTGDLELTTAAARTGADRAGSLLVFAAGLDYLRLTERVGTASAERGCATGGVPFETGSATGSYAPAGAGHGRCLALSGDATTVVLESNLPREELAAIAASLPLEAGAST